MREIFWDSVVMFARFRPRLQKRATSTSSAKVDQPERPVSSSRRFGNGEATSENQLVPSFTTAFGTSRHQKKPFERQLYAGSSRTLSYHVMIVGIKAAC